MFKEKMQKMEDQEEERPAIDIRAERRFLKEKLKGFPSLTLTERVNECNELFRQFGLAEEKYPEIYAELRKAASAHLSQEIKKGVKAARKDALDNWLVEDSYTVFSFTPEYKKPKHDVRIFNHFEKMMQSVYQQALKELSPELKEKWLGIARRRAEKGHLSRDIQSALDRAAMYARCHGCYIDSEVYVKIKETAANKQQVFAKENLGILKKYAMRILEHQYPRKYLERVLDVAEELSTDSGIAFYRSPSALRTLSEEFPELTPLFEQRGFDVNLVKGAEDHYKKS